MLPPPTGESVAIKSEAPDVRSGSAPVEDLLEDRVSQSAPRDRAARPDSSRSVKLRAYIMVFLLVFGLTPLVLAALINLPLVLDRTTLFYQRAYLQNLRADFRDLDQHQR
jgi:hypothetical protein